MKLRNKKTGEIRDFIINKDKIQTASAIDCWEYNSLAELNAEWEDYEEAKESWHIDFDGTIMSRKDIKCEELVFEALETIGNYFSTKEEAEKAVEKLKAWKRLKDKGFRFELWDYDGYNDEVETGKILFRINKLSEEDKDLDLLFGGES